jgi:hypothetical protein
MWVDKAGRYDKISSVDGFLCTIGDFTNRGNFSVGYGNIRTATRSTETINNSPILNQ